MATARLVERTKLASAKIC